MISRWVLKGTMILGVKSSENCFALNLKTSFFLDMLRSTAFPIILNYFSQFRCNMKVSSWSIHILYHFSRDLECREYFIKYLRTISTEADQRYRSELLVMQKVKNEDCCLEFSQETMDHFVFFKHTISYDRIYKQRCEYDCTIEK